MKIILIFILSFSAYGSELKDFKTDLCTYFPEGTGSRPGLWKDCCIYHDMKYWIGGTKKEQDESDLLLKSCVKEKANSFYAGIMYRGIRLGHLSPIKSKYRWGWGWSKRGFFGELTKGQLQQAKKLMLRSNSDPVLVDRFIKQYILK